MISKTILALIAAIIVIAAAGVAVVTLTGGDDTPETPTVPGEDDESPDAPEETPGEDYVVVPVPDHEDGTALNEYRSGNDLGLKVGDYIRFHDYSLAVEFDETFMIVGGEPGAWIVQHIFGVNQEVTLLVQDEDEFYGNLNPSTLDMPAFEKVDEIRWPTIAGQLELEVYKNSDGVTVYVSPESDITYRIVVPTGFLDSNTIKELDGTSLIKYA